MRWSTLSLLLSLALSSSSTATMESAASTRSNDPSSEPADAFHRAQFISLGEAVPRAISADGSVVVGGQSQAFRWTPVEGITSLGDLSGGDFASNAYGVSADGFFVAGWGSSPSGQQPFRWTNGDGMVGLGGLSGEIYFGQGYGISSDGSTVVGSSSSAQAGGLIQAFRWTSEDGMVGLGSLPSGSDQSEAYDASATGSVIVGRSGFASGPYEAFRWTSDGEMVGLGDFPDGPFRSSANAVSDDGSVIVGHGTTNEGPRAFRWTAISGMMELGDLPERTLGSAALATSADGAHVVGWTRVGSGSLEAFIWDSTNGMRAIKTILSDAGIDLPGWNLYEAYGVSDDGLTIVGLGRDPTSIGLIGWIAVLPRPTTSVLIDIKPGSDENRLNPMSHGVIPVAILGSNTFDVGKVDVTTLKFGPDGAAPKPGVHVEDVNRDSVVDLVARFATREAGIAASNGEACAKGELVDGTKFEGCDAIQVAPARSGAR